MYGTGLILGNTKQKYEYKYTKQLGYLKSRNQHINTEISDVDSQKDGNIRDGKILQNSTPKTLSLKN